MSPNAEMDAMLITNGWEPVACDGKRALGPAWATRPNTTEAIAAERAALPNARNTGIRTGYCAAVDNDLKNSTHAAAIERLIFDTLGDTLMRRVGSKGCLLCYHNQHPIPKITISADGKRVVEILGTGQQFVAYGIHPDTGREYEWSNSFLGGEPFETPLTELPAVSPEKLRELAAKIRDALTRLGYADVTVSEAGASSKAGGTRSLATGLPVSPPIVEAMLRCIPPNCDRNEWLIVCGGLCNAPIDDPEWDGLDVFTCWSRGDLHGGTPPDNFKGEEDCAAQWHRDQDKHTEGKTQ